MYMWSVMWRVYNVYVKCNVKSVRFICEECTMYMWRVYAVSKVHDVYIKRSYSTMYMSRVYDVYVKCNAKSVRCICEECTMYISKDLTVRCLYERRNQVYTSTSYTLFHSKTCTRKCKNTYTYVSYTCFHSFIHSIAHHGPAAIENHKQYETGEVEKYLPLLQKNLQKTLRRKIMSGRKCLERHYERIFPSRKDKQTFSSLSRKDKKNKKIWHSLTADPTKQKKSEREETWRKRWKKTKRFCTFFPLLNPSADYGVATISRLITIIGLFFRIQSLL